ncbi:uncharacterized protein ARMOST_18859 [Armillaria ostoyae]|uniref:Secreted protein n=1 Tax=Armillaria ostoyae TaxID=47428 RepID=A0A284S310_ARMOS|nr:uncharacterized protein ARMOST_18859 [Armillaria ostoyae]
MGVETSTSLTMALYVVSCVPPAAAVSKCQDNCSTCADMYVTVPAPRDVSTCTDHQDDDSNHLGNSAIGRVPTTALSGLERRLHCR